jgi:SSS family solute:Na+ symporter
MNWNSNEFLLVDWIVLAIGVLAIVWAVYHAIKKDKEKNIKGNIKEVNNGKEIKGKKDFNKGVKKP